ncbi:hypothetical protein QE152_g27856 [Popillia japonica]|uniref:Uncharacterized protein n=2 Tax=Popillia japonica TaxID=7064 RepID=A0AAW1JJB6_POPJA
MGITYGYWGVSQRTRGNDCRLPHWRYEIQVSRTDSEHRTGLHGVDRSKGDLRNLIGIVMDVTPDSFYKIGTKTGALSNLYSRCNKKCINKRCVCKKKGVICNSRCHNSTNCTNK